MNQPSLTDEFGTYMAWKCNAETWIISFMNGTEYMYLLEGTQRALLVDTGWGAGNLRGFVEGLTRLPIQVINTHFHPDHAGGNGEWQQVMVHPNWAEDACMLAEAPFDLAALPYPDYEKLPVADGQLIDLGNRQVEILLLTAHSNSSLMLLDEKYGMLLCGDELEAAQVLLYDLCPAHRDTYVYRQRLERHRANCERVKALYGKYRQLYPNHNGTPIDVSYVDDYIALCDTLLAGQGQPLPLQHRYIEMRPDAHTLCRVRKGRASFISRRADVEGLTR